MRIALHTAALAVTLPALLAPLAAAAGESSSLAVQARVEGYCRFIDPMVALVFGEIDPTARRIVQRSDELKFECSPGTTAQLQVEGEGRGPLTRHMTIPGEPARLPYQIDWSLNAAAPQSVPNGMATGALTFTVTLLPAHYRVALASPGYIDLVTVTLTP